MQFSQPFNFALIFEKGTLGSVLSLGWLQGSSVMWRCVQVCCGHSSVVGKRPNARKHHPQHWFLLVPCSAQGGFTNSFSVLHNKQIFQACWTLWALARGKHLQGRGAYQHLLLLSSGCFREGQKLSPSCLCGSRMTALRCSLQGGTEGLLVSWALTSSSFSLFHLTFGVLQIRDTVYWLTS